MRALPVAKLLVLPVICIALLASSGESHAQAMMDRPGPTSLTRPIAEEPALEVQSTSSLRQRITDALASIKANWRAQADRTRSTSSTARIIRTQR